MEALAENVANDDMSDLEGNDDSELVSEDDEYEDNACPKGRPLDNDEVDGSEDVQDYDHGTEAPVDEMDGTSVFVPVLGSTKKKPHKTAAIPSRRPNGETYTRRAKLYRRTTKDADNKERWIRIGLDTDEEQYYVRLSQIKLRVIELDNDERDTKDLTKELVEGLAEGTTKEKMEIENDGSQEKQLERVRRKMERLYEADRKGDNEKGLKILDENGIEAHPHQHWFKRLDEPATAGQPEDAFSRQLALYRVLIAAKGGFRAPMARYQSSDTIDKVKLYLFFDKDVFHTLWSGKDEAQTWLTDFEQRTNEKLAGKVELLFTDLITDDRKKEGYEHWAGHPLCLYQAYVTKSDLERLQCNGDQKGGVEEPRRGPDDKAFTVLVVDAWAKVLNNKIPSKIEDANGVDPDASLRTDTSGRLKQQAQVMRGGAEQLAQELWGLTSDQSKGQAEMGGLGALTLPDIQNSQQKANMIFGTKEVNTQMIRWEDCAQRWTFSWDEDRWSKIHLKHDIKPVLWKRSRKLLAESKRKNGQDQADDDMGDRKQKRKLVMTTQERIDYATTHPHLTTYPDKKSRDDLVKIWHEYQSRVDQKAEEEGEGKSTKDKSGGPNAKPDDSALSTFLWSIRGLRWGFSLDGQSDYRRVDMSTTFGMWSRQIPTLIEAKLDAALDDMLWEHGYWAKKDTQGGNSGSPGPKKQLKSEKSQESS